MNSEEKLFYRIGEIATHLNVNTSLLRFWEKEFASLIQPNRNKRGVRLYSKHDFDTFIRIHILVKAQGMTLKGAADKLSQDSKAHKDKHEVIRSLLEMKEFLLDLKKNL